MTQEGRKIEGIGGPLEAMNLPNAPDAMADFPSHAYTMDLRRSIVKLAV